MIIDCHLHCFPDSLAERAVVTLSKKSGLKSYTDGTISNTLSLMDKNGVDRAVVLNIAKKPNQDEKVNNFAIATNSHRLINLGSVHPNSDNVELELVRIAEAGIKGIKLHPEYQEFDADDHIADKIYAKASELGLIVVFHAGFDIAYPTSERAHPKKLRKVLDRFPNMKVQLAHFGGMIKWNYTLDYLAGSNAYIDISMAGRYIDRDIAKAIVRKHGSDRLLFGSDIPWECWQTQYKLVDDLELSSIDKDKLMYLNAIDFYKL